LVKYPNKYSFFEPNYFDFRRKYAEYDIHKNIRCLKNGPNIKLNILLINYSDFTFFKKAKKDISGTKIKREKEKEKRKEKFSEI